MINLDSFLLNDWQIKCNPCFASRVLGKPLTVKFALIELDMRCCKVCTRKTLEYVIRVSEFYISAVTRSTQLIRYWSL